MTAATIAAAPWLSAGLVALSAFVFRPRRRRVLPSRAHTRRPVSPVESIGGYVRRLGRRPAGTRADRRVGVALLVVAAALTLGVPAAALGLAALAIWPVVERRRQHARTRRQLIRELPEVIDLLRLALAGGGSVLHIVELVGRNGSGRIIDALAQVVHQVRRGRRLGDALEDMTIHLGDEVRPLARVLAGSDRYGTELGPSLARLAHEARDHRRRTLQTAARRVPVRLLLPLTLCILPAFVLLTVVPTLAGTLSGSGFGSGPADSSSSPPATRISFPLPHE